MLFKQQFLEITFKIYAIPMSSSPLSDNLIWRNSTFGEMNFKHAYNSKQKLSQNHLERFFSLLLDL